MKTIAKLFGQSPFVPLQQHMSKVSECVELVRPILEAYFSGDAERVDRLAGQVCELEHQADQLKHEIQDQIPRGLFLPVDRERLFEILAVQDSIADKVENMAVLLTLKQVSLPEGMRDLFESFLEKNLEAFVAVRCIVDELDELLSAGFGGVEAQTVREMVRSVSRIEFEGDLIQRDLLRALFVNEANLTVAQFFLLDRVLKQITGISNLSERLGHRIQRTLDLK